MSAIMLDTIRECFEGMIPAVLGTADLAGMQNASYLSQAQYMDRKHVALSYQCANILASPNARLTVVNPYTGAQYSLAQQYLRTGTSGQLFESVKAKLAGPASHTGMTGVFRLLGSDVFHVTEIICVDRDLVQLFDESMACLHEKMGTSHAMLLMQ